MLKVAQVEIALACFWGFMFILECLGCLQMAPYLLDKQTDGCDSSHNWLMSLVIDLASLCGVEVKMAPVDAI